MKRIKKSQSLKTVILIILILAVGACVSVSEEIAGVQLIKGNNNLITNCQKLGPIYTDTTGGPFNFGFVAESEFKRVALTKYKADSAVITSESLLPLGRVILQGAALKCYQ